MHFVVPSTHDMRPIILLPLFACVLVAQNAAQKTAYEMKYLEQKEDKIYLQGQEAPFTGLGVQRYKSGKPKFQIEYANGIQHGLTTIWWENGKPHTQQSLDRSKEKETQLLRTEDKLRTELVQVSAAKKQEEEEAARITADLLVSASSE